MKMSETGMFKIIKEIKEGIALIKNRNNKF